MDNLLSFFGWFFDAIWEFFKIPFPGLDMTIGAVFIAATCFYFGFRLLSLMFNTTTSSDKGDE